MRTVIGYVRVSTAEQVNGFGLDVQETAIRSYCENHDLDLSRIASDAGQSGSNGLDARQGLAEALAAVERGEASALVVSRLDRLARDLLLQETTLARMRAAGAEVLSVTEPDIDSEDATRVLVRQVLGAIAEYERAVIRGRMMAGKAAKIAQGGYGGGRPAFGWRAQDGALMSDPVEQEAIALARRLRQEGCSLRAIARTLDERGMRPRGGAWHPSQIARLVGSGDQVHG